MAATSLANPCVSARTETTSRSISSSIRKHLHQSRQFIPARRPIPPPGRHLRQNYGQFRRSGLPEFIRAPTEKQCSHSSSPRSEELTSALQSLMRISYAVLCLKQTKHDKNKI